MTYGGTDMRKLFHIETKREGEILEIGEAGECVSIAIIHGGDLRRVWLTEDQWDEIFEVRYKIDFERPKKPAPPLQEPVAIPEEVI